MRKWKLKTGVSQLAAGDQYNFGIRSVPLAHYCVYMNGVPPFLCSTETRVDRGGSAIISKFTVHLLHKINV